MDYPYLYETHLHTSEASACGCVNGADYIDYYLEHGYAGIIVTDHFLAGNTCIDRSLPWARQVELFCRGYENARAAGEKKGLDVFFGMEAGFDGDEFLLYGISKQWLLQHPDMSRWSRSRLFAEVDAIGGLVVQAHPFRQREYLHRILLYPHCCHAVEVVNFGNEQPFDARAAVYAAHWGLPMTGGSDTHSFSGPRYHGITAMAFAQKLDSVDDFVRAVRHNTGYILPDYTARTALTAPLRPEIPMWLFGEGETPLPATPNSVYGTGGSQW